MGKVRIKLFLSDILLTFLRNYVIVWRLGGYWLTGLNEQDLYRDLSKVTLCLILDSCGCWENPALEMYSGVCCIICSFEGLCFCD
uniref:Macaca fascicularis brain cDNA clone: QflA-19271, similar to human RNA binding motif protein 22 (RBM22), mRNA, RefSeq: NM_018047.1 n=1 Tax=Macaca fascicularis TaxID=9541 RepID=I7GN15_MACFA|nr:unnamed protein product [Macaca fascicularis]